ncbi:MAG: CHASE3 domain-containing protein [Burkholderiaceae bacterium]|jgi:diguanylate cyclase (GGDEF)-like protein
MARRPPLPTTTQVPPARVIERWLGLIALLAALVLAIAATLVHRVANDSIQAAQRVAHSFQVVAELDQLSLALEAAEAGQRGFILIGKPSYLEPYQLARFRTTLHLAALRPLTYGSSKQYDDLLRLEQLVTRRFDYLAHSIDVRQEQGADAARRILEADPGKSTIDPIEALVSSMQERERGYLQDNLSQQERYSDRALIVMVASLMLLAILSLIFWLFLKREFSVRHRLEAALLESAISDELTGAINRSEFERLLGQEWAFRMRYGTPLSLVLIDLDNFDEIRAAWGLHTGDAVLRDVVRRIRGRMRTTERLARFGGNQFALLVPQPRGAAMRLAGQLAELVSGSSYPIRNSQTGNKQILEVTVCIGVADASDVQEAPELIQAAGDALYAAKGGTGIPRIEAYHNDMTRASLTRNSNPA